MTREEFRAKWSARHTEWEKLSVMVNGAKMCEEFITDVEDVLTSHDEAVQKRQKRLLSRRRLAAEAARRTA